MGLRKISRQGAIVALALALSAPAAAYTFDDNFDAGASAQWSNSSGNWTTSGGTYLAQNPTNNPTTYSGLPFDFTDFTVTVDALNVGDSGIYLRTDGSNQNGVLLVIGGNGYGLGNRGGTAGSSLYFHTIQNGGFSGQLGQADFVVTPGEDYAIKVAVTGDAYDVYVNNVLATSFTTSLFSHGMVGLYDTQPGPNGSGAPSAFDNFSVTGTLYGAVPEPASWAMLIAGLGTVGAAMRRRKAAVSFA